MRFVRYILIPWLALSSPAGGDTLAFCRRINALAGFPPKIALTHSDREVEILKARAEKPFQPSETVTALGTVTTTEEIARQGHVLNHPALEALGIPKDAWEFYDPQSGRFDYKPTLPRELATENGSEPITAIRINIASSYDGKRGMDYLLSDYKNVLLKMPKVEVSVVTTEEHWPLIDKWREGLPPELKKRTKIVELGEEETDLEWWAHDGSKPLRTGPREVLMPRAPIRSTERLGQLDALLAAERAGVLKIRRSMFRFEGGNIVVGSRHALVGPNTVEAAMIDFHLTRPQAIEALSRELGKTVVEVGAPNEHGIMDQATFHLDFTLALAQDHRTGKEVVLMDSPREGFKALLGVDVDTLTEASLNAAKKRLREKRGLISINRTVLQNDLAEQLEHLSLANLKYRLAQNDYMKKQLESSGYDVVDMPGFTSLGRGDTEDRLAHPVNYVNVLLSGRQALVPATGVQTLDKAAAEVYRKMGYEIIPMSSAGYLYSRNGGTRCGAEVFRN